MQIRSAWIDLDETPFHLVALGDKGVHEEDVQPEAVNCIDCNLQT